MAKLPLCDDADWAGIHMRSVNVGARDDFEFEGYGYITEGELLIAKLLTRMKVPFTPDVAIHIIIPPEHRTGSEPEHKMYVPDFVFNRRAYIWEDGKNGPEVVHGIEAKRAQSGMFPRKALKYVQLLREQHGVNIKLLCEADIHAYDDKGRLPMHRFRKKSGT